MWYNITVEKKSKILIIAFVVALVVSIILTYQRSFITKDFEVIESEEEEFLEEEFTDE